MATHPKHAEARHIIKRECGFAPTDYQRAFMRDPAQLKVMLKARRLGGTTCVLWQIALEMASKPMTRWLISSASLDLARETMRNLRQIFRKLWNLGCHCMLIGDAQGRIALSNGSEVTAVSSNPDSLIGYTANVFIDEVGVHKDQDALLTAALPLTLTGGRVILTSTPRGAHTLFHDICEKPEKYQFSLHRVTLQDALASGYHHVLNDMSKCSKTPEEWLAEMRARSVSETSFQREYNCVFTEDAGALLSWDELNSCTREPPDLEGAAYYAGVDVGRTNDFTVITIVAKTANGHLHLVHQRCLHGTTFAEQYAVAKRLIGGGLAPSTEKERADVAERKEAFLSAMREEIVGCASPVVGFRCSGGYCDRTGIGMQIAEQLQETTACRGLHFTQQTKHELASNLKWLVSSGKLTLPASPTLLSDLNCVKAEETTTGIKYEGRTSEGSHADRFWSLALACLAATKQGIAQATLI